MKVIDNGLTNFRDVIEKDKFYVDKTLFIKEFVTKSSEVTLITRPRKFGKTLNLDMLECFLDIKDDSKTIFSNLNIGKEVPFLEEHQNKYPVIRLDFQDISVKDGIEGFKASFYSLISKAYRSFGKEINEIKMDKVTLDDYNAIYYNNINPILADEALLLLTQLVYDAYYVKPIILIDDYDKPLERAYEAGFYDEASIILMDFLSRGLRGNKYLNKALLLGCSQLAQIGMITNLNNIEVHSIRKDELFSRHFGFTQEEVTELLKLYNLSDQFNKVKKWYNGYLFNNATIFNPWSVSKYLKRKEFDLYWPYTGKMNHLKNSLLNINYVTLFEKLVSNTAVKSPYKPLITYNKPTLEEGEVLSLLYQAGYLKHVDDEDFYTVNEEIRVSLKDTFLDILDKDAKFPKFLTNFFKNLTQLKIANAETDYESAIKGKPYLSEEVHYSILSTMQNFMADSYSFTRENPTVRGRYDSTLRSTLNNNNAFIIEVRTDVVLEEKDIDNRLDELISDAMAQIERRKFENNLKNDEGFKNVHKVAIVVCNKQVRIRLRKQDIPEYKDMQKFLFESKEVKKTTKK